MLPATAADFNGTVTFPETAIASSPAEAVEKYSFFKTSTTTTFENPSFTLDQNATFVDFDITLEDGTTAGKDLDVTINNSGSVVRTGSVTTVADESGTIKAKFTAAFYGGDVTLSGANVTLDAKGPISFGGTTNLEANKIYRVKKGIYEAEAKYTLTATAFGAVKELKDKTLPICTTIAELTNNNSLVNCASKIVVKSGTNITLGTFNTTDPGSTEVFVTGSGTSVITVTASMFGTSSDVDVTVTVVKQ